MPKRGGGADKKTEQKKKDRIIEDKTFGLKNKKGSKQQKYIQNVTNQVKYGNMKAAKLENEKEKESEKKMNKKKFEDEVLSLFKPVQDQKVGKGVDPKSVLCAFFKQGSCSKGAKCKFSHDPDIQRKTEKKNLYEDTRKDDEMDSWDQATLEEAVNKKHGAKNKSLPPTSIICKHFLDAVENNKYGWFWECPNGGDNCHYRHALPPGFVLKKDAKAMDEQKEPSLTLEELIERERASLGTNLTKITLQSFLAWKQRKRKEKVKAAKKAQAKRKADFKTGKTLGISGRDLFTFDPTLISVENDNEIGDNEDDTDADVFVMENMLDDDSEMSAQAMDMEKRMLELEREMADEQCRLIKTAESQNKNEEKENNTKHSSDYTATHNDVSVPHNSSSDIPSTSYSSRLDDSSPASTSLSTFDQLTSQASADMVGNHMTEPSSSSPATTYTTPENDNSVPIDEDLFDIEDDDLDALEAELNELDVGENDESPIDRVTNGKKTLIAINGDAVS